MTYDIDLCGHDVLLWWLGVRETRELLAPARGDNILIESVGLEIGGGGMVDGWGCVGIILRGDCLNAALVRLL